MIREAVKSDLYDLLKLYMQLHDNPMPQQTPELLRLWEAILADNRHHIIVAEEHGKQAITVLIKRRLSNGYSSSRKY